MSRSKHTDPKTIRAARRLRAPRLGRGTGDLSRRRELGRELKTTGVDSGEPDREPSSHAPLRIRVQKPRNGFHHPAGKRDVLKMLNAVGPIALYGLRSVELVRSPDSGSTLSPVFGRYSVPGRILLFTGGPSQLVVIPDESRGELPEHWGARFGNQLEFAHLRLPATEFPYHYRLVATIALAEISRQVGRRPAINVPAGARPPIYDSALEELAETSGEIVRLADLADY